MSRVFLLLFFISFLTFSQNTSPAFQNGEFLKYKLSYSLIHAGFATLQVDEIEINNKDLIHVNGKGWTVGVVDFFFSVKDNYQTYFDKNTSQPHHFIRKINEGGYSKDKEIFFDFKKKQAIVKNHKKKSENSYFIQNDVQDMLSALYYLRNMNFDTIKKYEIFTINMFYDNQMIKIDIKYIGKEVIDTKYGKINTIVIKPQVEAGRIFKEDDSVTIWLSDDKNKVPLKIKANVLIGSIKAEIFEHKELMETLIVIFN